MEAKELLKRMLEKRATEDTLFATTFAKENKTIDGCWNYVLGEARKKAKNSCCAMSDDEVLSLAVHYYDEDDIEEPAEKVRAQTSVSSYPKGDDDDFDDDEESAPLPAPKKKLTAKQLKKLEEDKLQLSLF